MTRAIRGDLVVVWRKKRGPLITRRIAQQSPFSTFWFRSLETGELFELPCNKVSAIHAVVGGELNARHRSNRSRTWERPGPVLVAGPFLCHALERGAPVAAG